MSSAESKTEKAQRIFWDVLKDQKYIKSPAVNSLLSKFVSSNVNDDKVWEYTQKLKTMLMKDKSDWEEALLIGSAVDKVFSELIDVPE